MDAGFLNFHGGEHFSTLDPTYFLESHAPDEGSSYDGEQGYAWDWDNDREVELNGDIGLIPVTSDAADDYCVMSTSPPSKEDFHKIMLEWQHLVNIETENVEELPPDVISNDALGTAEDSQDVIEYKYEPTNIFATKGINLCDTTDNINLSDRIKDVAPSPIPSVTSLETLPQTLTRNRLKCEEITPIQEDTDSEGDILATIASPINIYSNIDDPMGHLANSDFDITKYVNETDRSILPSGPGPGGKRLDLKNQRYVVDSEDDDEDPHIDVETLSETNASSMDLEETDCYGTEIKSDIVFEAKDMMTIKKEMMEIEPDNAQVDCCNPTLDNDFTQNKQIKPEVVVKVENTVTDIHLPAEIVENHGQDKSMGLETRINNMIKELDMQNADLDLDGKKTDNILDIEVQEIKETNLSSIAPSKRDISSCNAGNKTKEIAPVIQAGDLNSLLEQFEASQASDPKPRKVKVVEKKELLMSKDANEDNTRRDHTKTKQILESLPEELINRIKQSSKRKSISVIPPIPNKKRGNKPIANTNNTNTVQNHPNNSCESVQMDHDYCATSSNTSSSSSSSCSSTSSKKDSGFSSCEEDERSILRNQPTVKTADGKLMVSLLKVNTIKKRKLNLEEYKQRRQERSCSGSPARIENENARRLQRMNVQPRAPPNMEVKTFVSIGVNTDQSWGRLREIVGGCPSTFSPNSFITSLVDHLPQIKEVNAVGAEHGEDKTIVYLDKNRKPPKTSNKNTQTATHRRRSSSSSSSCSRSSRSRTRSPSPAPRRHRSEMEKVREVEERRVIYVGRIANSVTRECLRKRFQRFGPITNVSVHFRRAADNYGFVTFKYKEDAYEAIEHGNEDPSVPQYDLSFGGRRIFCQTTYADLDNLREDCYYHGPPCGNAMREDSFEELLRETQVKLLRNKRLHNKS